MPITTKEFVCCDSDSQGDGYIGVGRPQGLSPSRRGIANRSSLSAKRNTDRGFQHRQKAMGIRVLGRQAARQVCQLEGVVSRRFSTATKTNTDTKRMLRELLRATAQPVAVVTSHYPLDGASEVDACEESPRTFHGATLSSFTSIALDPHPLVAFSLRIPSRMATSLKQLMVTSSSPSPQTPKRKGREVRADFVVNLLSSTQASVAHTFARADLFPDPFRIVPHALTSDGLPVLEGSLGALSCNLVSHMPLEDLVEKDEDAEEKRKDGLISELFISRVLRVESVGIRDPGESVLPLLYHHRRYATAHQLDMISS